MTTATHSAKKVVKKNRHVGIKKTPATTISGTTLPGSDVRELIPESSDDSTPTTASHPQYDSVHGPMSEGAANAMVDGKADNTADAEAFIEALEAMGSGADDNKDDGSDGLDPDDNLDDSDDSGGPDTK